MATMALGGHGSGLGFEFELTITYSTTSHYYFKLLTRSAARAMSMMRA